MYTRIRNLFYHVHVKALCLFLYVFVAILRGHAMTKRSSSQGGFLGGDELLRFLRVTEAPKKKKL